MVTEFAAISASWKGDLKKLSKLLDCSGVVRTRSARAPPAVFAFGSAQQSPGRFRLMAAEFAAIAASWKDDLEKLPKLLGCSGVVRPWLFCAAFAGCSRPA